MSQARWGLPFVSLQLGSRYEDANPGRRFALSSVQTGIRFSNSIDRGLPLDPLWLGFLANTALYAGLVFGVLHLRAGRRERVRPALGIAKEDRVV